jgi:hypothetical protein
MTERCKTGKWLAGLGRVAYMVSAEERGENVWKKIQKRRGVLSKFVFWELILSCLY